MIKKNRSLCTICARGGSKGVKNKNVRLIGDKPLIAHSILQARESGLFEHIVVSTDSEHIASVAKEFGAEILFMRPANLATDEAKKLPVIKHAVTEAERILKKSFDFIFDLDATSILRNLEDIQACYALISSDYYGNIITGCPARRSPYFNLIELNEYNVPFVSKGTGNIARRQDSPKCFDMNASIYAWRKEVLLSSDSLFLDNTHLYVMPEERSIDIDSELDFYIVSSLLASLSPKTAKLDPVL